MNYWCRSRPLAWASTAHTSSPETAGFQRGDRIAFVSSPQPKGGTWAEYAAVKASSLLMPLPAAADFVHAGASVATGTLGIRLARQRQWRVAASASAGNHPYLRSLGAEMVVDYRTPTRVQRLRQWMPDGVDAALAVPPGTAEETLPHVVDTGPEMRQLMADVAAGSIHVELEQVYPFDDALAALAKVQTRRARGGA